MENKVFKEILEENAKKEEEKELLNKEVSLEKNEEKELEKKEIIETTEILEETTENKEDTENKEQEKTEEINMENQEDQKFQQLDEREAEKLKQALDSNKKVKRRKGAIILVLLVIIAILILSTIFSLINVNNNSIYNGVYIEGIDFSGKTKEQTVEELKVIYEEKSKKEIILEYGEYISNLNPTALEVSYNIEKAAEEAYLYGKSDNIFINNYKILNAMIFQNEIDVEMTLNEEITNNTIKEIGSNLPGVVVEASYVIEEAQLVITEGHSGIIIDNDKLLATAKEIFSDINNTEMKIQIPILNKEPDEVDITKIHEEVVKEPQDAYVILEPLEIFPEVEGIEFDLEAAKAIIETNQSPYIIPIVRIQPNISIEDLGAEAFPAEIAVFTTRYDPSDINRTTNLVLSSQAINEIVLLPGEVFSYNEALGPRTVARGYRSAKIYSAGEVIDGLGGGICQVSSTLYNAALRSDLEIVERQNHQFVTSYVTEGRDATVVYGAIDFQFKNTRTYPIKIKSSVVNGICTVAIYGIPEEQYTYQLSTTVISTLPYSTIYEEDPSMSVGTEVVKQGGSIGKITETYMTKLLDGVVIETKLLSRDTYTPMTRIVVKGTAAIVEPTPTTEPEVTVSPETTIPPETTGDVTDII